MARVPAQRATFAVSHLFARIDDARTRSEDALRSEVERSRQTLLEAVGRAEDMERQLATARQRSGSLHERATTLEAQVSRLEGALAAATADAAQARRALDAVHATRTMRWTLAARMGYARFLRMRQGIR
jgi:chromosome segregation ATPase